MSAVAISAVYRVGEGGRAHIGRIVKAMLTGKMRGGGRPMTRFLSPNAVRLEARHG